MNRSGKRSAALLLALCLLLGLLAGCGKKNNAQQLSATVYVPKYLDLDLNLDYVRGGCSDGEYIYLIGQKENQLDRKDPETGESYTYWEYIYDIYRVSLEDGAVETLPNYEAPSIPEGKDGSAYIEDIAAVGDGTFWVRECTYIWGDLDVKYPVVDDVFTVAASSSVVSTSGSALVYAQPEAEVAEPESETEDAGTEDSEAEDADEPEDAAADTDIAVDMPVPTEPDSYERQEVVVRRHLDAQGNELERIDISDLQETLADVLEDDAYIYSTTFDSAGNLYAVTDSKIYVLDPRMNLLFTVDGKDLWSELIPLGNGTVGMQKWDYDEATETSTNKLLTIDSEKRDWGPEYILPSNVYTFYPGGGEYLCYYRVNDAIYGWKGASSGDADGAVIEGERLFSWIEADINSSDVRSFFFLPDGRVAAITQEWPEDGKGGAIISVILMTATPRDQLPEKTTLIYGTMYLSYDARRKIIDFNKRSETHRIEVRDYSEYVTDGNDDGAALQKLNTEIMAGTIPDILDTSNMPIRQYGAKGVLEDLWPYIDKDPDLGRDALMLRPLEANQQDGKLYEIFGDFYIRTAVGPGKIVGDRTSWTLADLQEALERMPEGCSIFGQSDTKDGMLGSVLAMNMDQFVDWDTGECFFDGDQFKAMLSFCNSFPAEFNWENVDWETWEDDDVRIMNGKQLLAQYYMGGFDLDVQRLAAVFNGDYSYIGYPKEDGGCGSTFSTGRGIAMSASCKDKDGAWSFVRQVLLPQIEVEEIADGNRYYYYGSFPINKSDFDNMVTQALTPQYETDENGDPLLDDDGQPILVDYGSMWVGDGVEVPIRPVSQEDVDRIMELYGAVDSVYRYDEKIYNAVQEVASQYFAGDKPLDDAAMLIQSKVKLYVNESK